MGDKQIAASHDLSRLYLRRENQSRTGGAEREPGPPPIVKFSLRFFHPVVSAHMS